MLRHHPSRNATTAMAAILSLMPAALISAALFSACRLNAQTAVKAPAPADRRPAHAAMVKPMPRPNGEHLAEWMTHHSNLSPEQQQKALQAEPGFSQLPPVVQQHEVETLNKLNAMPPEQRQRLLERNEAVERMSPAQRAQFRDAMKQLNDLPVQERVYVARTFRGLRELNPQQRQAVLASERFNHLTDQQRAALNSLLAVEPFFPPAYDANASVQPPAQPPAQP